MVGLALIVGVFTQVSALMGVLMKLAFRLAGTTSNNPPMLVVGLTSVLAGGAMVGYYGIDRLIQPFVERIMQRIRAIVTGRRGETPQPA